MVSAQNAVAFVAVTESLNWKATAAFVELNTVYVAPASAGQESVGSIPETLNVKDGSIRNHFVSVRYCRPSSRVTMAKNGCNPICKLEAGTEKYADDWFVTTPDKPPVLNNSMRAMVFVFATTENGNAPSPPVFISQARQFNVAASVEFWTRTD